MENQFTVLVLIKSSGNSWQSLRYGLCDVWREIIKMYIHSQGTSGEIKIVTAMAAAFGQVPGLQLSSGLGCSSMASSVDLVATHWGTGASWKTHAEADAGVQQKQ